MVRVSLTAYGLRSQTVSGRPFSLSQQPRSPTLQTVALSLLVSLETELELSIVELAAAACGITQHHAHHAQQNCDAAPPRYLWVL